MSDFTYYSDELLQPISAEQPCGTDLRYALLFGDITEARRSDDELSAGEWEKQGGRKLAEWDLVARLCVTALREQTKDLRLACYLTEAAVRLDGFSGLRDCLRLTTDMLVRFWDLGLFPPVEDGDLEYRASALAWLNERIPDVLGQVPITARTGAENYGFARYQQAQRVGTEAAFGSVSADKRETIQGLVQQGWITMDTFDAALRGTKRDALEHIYQPFDQAHQQLLVLEKAVDERFGRAAPTFSAIKDMFSEIRKVLAPALKKKQEEETSAAHAAKQPGQVLPVRAATAGGPMFESTADSNRAWEEAELLVRSGKVDQGLVQMAALAAQETSGRARFLRKLMLSEVCLSISRDRLARTVLEELNRQIEEYKLERWESSGLVGAVWSRLYKLYRKSDSSADLEAAAQLYNQLCRLDPWQAFLSCED